MKNEKAILNVENNTIQVWKKLKKQKIVILQWFNEDMTTLRKMTKNVIQIGLSSTKMEYLIGIKDKSVSQSYFQHTFSAIQN